MRGIQARKRCLTVLDSVASLSKASRISYYTQRGFVTFYLTVKKLKLMMVQGQVMLVESPETPLTRMYFRSPQRVNKDTTYVFPRNPGGGVILGGCRFDNEWTGGVDLEFADDIKRRCCALAPELGKPEDLRVIQHGVGLRRE